MLICCARFIICADVAKAAALQTVALATANAAQPSAVATVTAIPCVTADDLSMVGDESASASAAASLAAATATATATAIATPDTANATPASAPAATASAFAAAPAAVAVAPLAVQEVTSAEAVPSTASVNSGVAALPVFSLEPSIPAAFSVPTPLSFSGARDSANRAAAMTPLSADDSNAQPCYP